MAEKFKAKKRGLWAGLSVAAILAFYGAKMEPASSAVPPAGAALELKAVRLSKKNITSSTGYIGYVVPIHQVSLEPNVSGYISKIWVEGGQDVKIGDNLLMIDQREYKAAYDAAVAAQNQAQADYANASVYFERIKKAGPKAVSKTEFDNAKAQYLNAEAAYAAAKADTAKAKVMLDYTLLQASIDGTIGNVALTPGNYVAPGAGALLSIVQYDPIRVVFSISDKEYLQLLSSAEPLLSGQKIRVRLASGELYPETGIFRFTDNRLDNATNAIAVYADFKNPDKKLVANAYVDVLLEKEYKDAFVIAQNYVSLTPEGVFAHIVKDNKLVKIKLDILTMVGNDYVVGNQFGQNEYLVVDKVPAISPQTKVRIRLVNSAPQEQK